LAIARATRSDLRLDIVGAGDDRRRLEALADALGQRTNVTFHGFVDEVTKIRLLQTAVANLFPSPKEGWGITVMEAAACGTLSIASDSPGLRDSVLNGETGFLVPHGDPLALAERMVSVAADSELRSRLGRSARQHAERWTWDDAALATERQLDLLVATRGNLRK
jgi:glycosyltransferase involved in cell wall biosynthesis